KNMNIILSIEDVDLQECELLVSGFFEDERPLKGTSGLIDWRLNGRLSHLLKEGRMTGEWQETTLIPSRGRLTPPFILLLGLGKVRDYSTLRLRALFPHLFETLRNLRSSAICFSFPANEQYNVDCGKSAEVLLEAMADCLEAGLSSDEHWVSKLQLFFTVEEEKFPEILLGVQTAQSILKDRLKMRIFTPSMQRARAIP
ncbi:MAG: M17 family peptidase N-terminal domain-containing protein, partial [Thermodesulfobacteriota bacterium]